MQDRQSVDRYFTEQVVGPPFSVTMGPSVGVRSQPARGVLVDGLSGLAELSALAMHSAWASDPSEVVMGRPVSLPTLSRWRRGLVLTAWVGWSALLGTAVWLWSSR